MDFLVRTKEQRQYWEVEIGQIPWWVSQSTTAGGKF